MATLPNKYIPVSHSVLGVASAIVQIMRGNDTVTTLWDRIHKDDRVRTFDRYAEALSLLYAGGVVTFTKGVLRLQN